MLDSSPWRRIIVAGTALALIAAVIAGTTLVLYGDVPLIHQYDRFDLLTVDDTECEQTYESCTCTGLMTVMDSYPPQYQCMGIERCNPVNETACPAKGAEAVPSNATEDYPAPMPSRTENYTLASGIHSNPGNETMTAFTDEIHIEDAEWLRLRFAHHHLGDHSYLTITSAEDGAEQTLNRRTMQQWNNSSAYFNGDTVEITLHVAPGEDDTHFSITEVEVGEPNE